jgi:hypothetical protein
MPLHRGEAAVRPPGAREAVKTVKVPRQRGCEGPAPIRMHSVAPFRWTSSLRGRRGRWAARGASVAEAGAGSACFRAAWHSGACPGPDGRRRRRTGAWPAARPPRRAALRRAAPPPAAPPAEPDRPPAPAVPSLLAPPLLTARRAGRSRRLCGTPPTRGGWWLRRTLPPAVRARAGSAQQAAGSRRRALRPAAPSGP